MGLFDRFIGKRDEVAGLYAAIVARARQPHWYLEGAVADSVDGRFDMIAAVLAMAMLRLEDDDQGKAAATHLAEAFVDDMDPQLREIGIGDLLVGKHIGRMMAMLGGRLGAYREGLAAGDLKPALVRNLYRGDAPADSALAHVEHELLALRDELAAVATDRLIAGELA
ncbi:ubiquinol-cytochrome C chaperone family protein [Sphingomonas sp.]|jgi:cytochrome b pre-mRNA-processing protein 3|uniref:ubiquinol-cytochrome C chaperone family protein n=1 Tax=Sphingomonas sp. TaxID=28214 RepID=UPI002E2FD977|nr:ubiquinol-cytochrome C chaperone family protein [Sphingomonas sp.]HEX4695776.1 ubiquinol-cytochrome C chaperone family protein [Sphingomonas sp.]